MCKLQLFTFFSFKQLSSKITSSLSYNLVFYSFPYESLRCWLRVDLWFLGLNNYLVKETKNEIKQMTETYSYPDGECKYHIHIYSFLYIITEITKIAIGGLFWKSMEICYLCWNCFITLTVLTNVLDTPVHLVEEIDGVRIISNLVHEFLEKVPGL